MSELFSILKGDSVERLHALGTGSVQLAVTSPPYDALRTYGGHSWDFEATAKELTRLICSSGVICWNVKDSVVDGSETLTSAKQKIFFREICGLRIHQTLIYQKRNFSHPCANRYHSCFEYVLVLSKGIPGTFNPICDRKNLTAGAIGNLGVNTFTERDGSKSVRPKKVTTEFGKRHDVWLGNTRGQEEMCKPLPHPAMMPKWLARDLIRSYSNEGDTVLDCFAGSGTTGTEALKLGRKTVLVELNPAYIELIKQRCEVASQFSLETLPVLKI